MRAFLMLYVSDFDDERRPYMPGKSRSSERQAFNVLTSVCWDWRHTLCGWPESPTGQWVRHQLTKLIQRECIFAVGIRVYLMCIMSEFTVNVYLTQCGVLLTESFQLDNAWIHAVDKWKWVEQTLTRNDNNTDKETCHFTKQRHRERQREMNTWKRDVL